MTDGPRFVAVVDIGKTNAKVALVDLETRAEIADRRRANRPLPGPPYPHHDVDALWAFIIDALAELAAEHGVDAIAVTTHGATAALLDASGNLVLPVLDYEFGGPDNVRTDYEAMRPPFAETGSPALPAGLNLGAQLVWQQRMHPDAFAKVAAVLTYPQYWTHRLTGVAASEATSLGCHTDLWNPHAGDFSSLVDTMGWRGLFPPLRDADAVLAPILPDIAEAAGLDPATPVVCGIHDSNASLLPHLLGRQAPFAVVSTGTWVVSMAVGGRATTLDPRRDTLVNVSAFGDPVPSARFMGGREFETAMAGAAPEWSDADVQTVLASGTMLLPSLQQGSGPYPARAGGWVGHEPEGGPRFVAVSFYLALMTATSLDLIGAEGGIVVEGPFASNRAYLSMLSAATGRPVRGQSASATGTSVGAALLLDRSRSAPQADWPEVVRSDEMTAYARAWRSRVRAGS